MADNRGVAYMGTGKVEVQDIAVPRVRAPGRAWGQPRQRRAQAAPRSDPQGRLDEHLRLRPAHGPRAHDRARGPDPGARDHRRGDRRRPGGRVHQGGRPLLRAVQHRVRALPQVQGGPHRRVPERQPRPARLRVRLRRHGRLGRRAGRVRARPLRRLEPPEVPRQGPGDGEDPRPDDAVGHLPDRASTAPTRRGAARARRSTSRAPARSASPRPTRRSCSARPSSSSAT